MIDKAERETRRDMGHMNRTWARDLTRACQLLYDLGATDEEVDLILGSQFVPSNVDEDWALRARAWYAVKVEGL